MTELSDERIEALAESYSANAEDGSDERIIIMHYSDMVKFARSLLAAKQPEPPSELLRLALRELRVAGRMYVESGDTGRRIAAIEAIETYLAAPPAGPMREPVAIWRELKAILVKVHPEDSAWEPSISHLATKLDRALAAQPSPEGGEAEREALQKFAEFVDKESSGKVPIWLWLARFGTTRAALSRKETPYASD